MMFDTIAIVGVGLIGGSIARAVQVRGLARRVIGYSRHTAHGKAARRAGVVHESVTDLRTAVNEADCVIFCTPVDRIAKQIRDAIPHCRPGTVLTDAGSTKARICAELRGHVPGHLSFVGSHPLAGSEKSGFEHARADLFEGRVTIITPDESTSPEAMDLITRFWQGLGSRVITMSPVEHDDAVAWTSHVPHAIAATLAAGLPAALHLIAASGFKDTTRIAAGDPELWTAIFRENQPAILAALSDFTQRLRRFQELLQGSDDVALKQFLTDGKQVRDALGG